MSNPASRLHAILSRAASVAQGEQTINGWRHSLQLPKDMDEFAVMSKVGRVFTLPDIIAREVERFKDLDLELYLGWRTDLAQAFRLVNYQVQFQQFSSRLSKSLLMNIRFCAYELDKRLPEKELSPEQIEELRKAVWELYDLVLKSDVPPDLARYALDHLFLIIEALDSYEITGAAGVEMALNAVVGAVITENKISKSFADSKFGDACWRSEPLPDSNGRRGCEPDAHSVRSSAARKASIDLVFPIKNKIVTMRPIDGYFLIKLRELAWRPSNMMKIPNAHFLKGGSSSPSSMKQTRSEIASHLI